MLHNFLKTRVTKGSMTELRSAAADRFIASGWPKPSDEAWRFTNLNKLCDRALAPVTNLGASLSSDAVNQNELYQGARLVIVNGVIDATQSTDLPEGMRLVTLGDDAEMEEMLEDARITSHPIANLTLSVLSSGFGIRISGQVNTPLSLVYVNDGDDSSAHAVGVIILDDGASATIFEHHTGTGSGLSAPLLAIKIDEKAILNHARVQIEDEMRYHLSETVMTIGREGRYQALSVQSGGVLSRSETHIALVGEDIDMRMTTIYLARDKQVMDVTSLVDHRMPRCTSRQIVRGVLDDQSRGVFQGKVIVARDAQRTDGNQMSRTLLLSRKCEADAKPELEIYADDVACSHGATVGEIDDNHLFYLTSRGISKQEARQILIEAFLADVLDDVEAKNLVDFAKDAVASWLDVMRAR